MESSAVSVVYRVKTSSSEEEALEILKWYLDRIQSESGGSAAESARKVLSLCLRAPEVHVRKAALRALLDVKLDLYTPEFLELLFSLSRDDPNVSVRRLAERAILSVLSKASAYKDALKQTLNAILRRKVYVNVTDVVKAIGVERVKEVAPELSGEEKELVDFALSELEKGR